MGKGKMIRQRGGATVFTEANQTRKIKKIRQLSFKEKSPLKLNKKPKTSRNVLIFYSLSILLIFHGKMSMSEYFFYRLLSFLLQPKEKGNRGQLLTGSGDVCECHNPQPPGRHTVTKMMCSAPPELTVREDIGGQGCWREFIFLPSFTLIPSVRTSTK